MRELIKYFNALRNEGYNSHEAVAIAKDEDKLAKGDKQAWTAFYATYPDHEFKEIEA